MLFIESFNGIYLFSFFTDSKLVKMDVMLSSDWAVNVAQIVFVSWVVPSITVAMLFAMIMLYVKVKR
ncbi:hypothetical protein BIY21_13715 [Vibrio ponticus]|uniref:Uncharacterized protein n=1 Tax=Vibrio ponticus TaxID=265668 RepID=A0ABX3FIG9_9VIBR|nr:hypothetical protein BIY21_13715 [Vibrio ponticus]